MWSTQQEQNLQAGGKCNSHHKNKGKVSKPETDYFRFTPGERFCVRALLYVDRGLLCDMTERSGGACQPPASWALHHSIPLTSWHQGPGALRHILNSSQADLPSFC